MIKARFDLGLGAIVAAVMMTILTQATTLRSVVLQNVALAQSMSPWLVQANWLLDAPCEGTAELQGVKAQFQEATELGKAPARVQTHLGRLAWAQGDCDDAINYWQQALQDGDPFAGFELARVGREDAVSPDLQVKLAERAYTYAITLRDRGDQRTAQRWFEHAYKLAPQPRSAVALAIQYEREGRIAEVTALWQRMADRLSPANPDYWWAVARLHEQDGDWAAAGLAYQQGAELSSDPYDFWLHAGRAWEKTPEWNKAVDAYENAVAATSYPGFAYLGLGYGYSGQGNYQEALRYLQLAQEADPDYYRSYYYLGLTYYRMQDFANAKHNLELALQRGPDDASVMYLLAQTWHDMGQPETAEALLVRAIDHLYPPPADWWVQLGDWRLAQQRCEDAAQAYASAQSAGAEASAIQAKSVEYGGVCGANRSFLADPAQDSN
ncbi:MAG: tetratricopeptide repeat protein [Anaerolineae bacterium]